MPQETAKEFSERFKRAVEGHPLAPPTPYGVQAWVLDKLKTETGLEVSPNTMSKWFSGSALPRPDNIRKIAKVLQVDEVWLSMGRMPQEKVATPAGAERGEGATLLLAGLIESAGGRVIFPSTRGDNGIDLHVNLDGRQIDISVKTLTGSGKRRSCMVPEPVGDARIIAVAHRDGSECGATACVDLYDLTNLPRKHFGGFSVIELEPAEGRQMRCVDGDHAAVAPLALVSAMAEA